MKEEYNEFINSDEWKSKKEKIIEERGLYCEKCENFEFNKSKLHLHHKNYDKEFGMEADEDLILVCENCHNELHQDAEFFDNPEKKLKCPICHKFLNNNYCNFCAIKIEGLDNG